MTMPFWVPLVLTASLPVVAIAASALCFLAFPNEIWPVAIVLVGFPLGLWSGYIAASRVSRGLAVAAGGLVLEALGVGLLIVAPLDFEDAGVLIGGVAALIALGMIGYAAVATWDLWRARRTQGRDPGRGATRDTG